MRKNRSILTVIRVVLEFLSGIVACNIAMQYCIVIYNNTEGLFFSTAQRYYRQHEVKASLTFVRDDKCRVRFYCRVWCFKHQSDVRSTFVNLLVSIAR